MVDISAKDLFLVYFYHVIVKIALLVANIYTPAINVAIKMHNHNVKIVNKYIYNGEKT